MPDVFDQLDEEKKPDIFDELESEPVESILPPERTEPMARPSIGEGPEDIPPGMIARGIPPRPTEAEWEQARKQSRLGEEIAGTMAEAELTGRAARIFEPNLPRNLLAPTSEEALIEGAAFRTANPELDRWNPNPFRPPATVAELSPGTRESLAAGEALSGTVADLSSADQALVLGAAAMTGGVPGTAGRILGAAAPATFGVEGLKSIYEGGKTLLSDEATPEERGQAKVQVGLGASMLPGLGALIKRPTIPPRIVETIARTEAAVPGALNKAKAALADTAKREPISDQVQQLEKPIEKGIPDEQIKITETQSEITQPQAEAAVAREPARAEAGQEREVLLTPEPAAATAAGVPPAELTADIARYNEIQAELTKASETNPMAFFEGPLPKEKEAIKNKYGGFEPVEPPVKTSKALPTEKFEVSVQAEDPAYPGTGFVQIVDTGVKAENVKSPTVESLRAAGVDVPDFSKLPTGKYTWKEAIEKSKSPATPTTPTAPEAVPARPVGGRAAEQPAVGAAEGAPKPQETITTAAVRSEDGTIYTGKWHPAAYEQLMRAKGITKEQAIAQQQGGQVVDGFVTSEGRFVDRNEAATIASAAKQFRPDKEGDIAFAGGLKGMEAGPGIIEPKPTTAPLASAEAKLSQVVNQAIEQSSPTRLGVSPAATMRPTDVVLGAPDLRSISPAVEARWQAAVKGTETLLDRAKLGAENAWKSITREYADLPPREFPAEIDVLRRLRASRNASARTTVDVLKGITNNLGPKQYGVFNRVALLEDLVKDVEAGKYTDGRDLPFGYKDAGELTADLNKFRSVSEATPQIKAALERRREFMDSMRSTLVERGFLPESVLQDPRYFHHQVLMYMAERNAPTGSRSFRDWFSGWQKKRTGSSQDYNRQYVEAEAGVLSDAFNKIAMQDLQGEMRGISDLTAELKELHGAEWRQHIPKTHTEWQPKRGNAFYPVQTVAERVMDRYLSGLGDILPSEFKEALAMGGRKQEWVIPKPLAKVLDNIAPRPDNWIGKLATTMDRSWKKYILLNPLRAAKYNLNNLSGDLDFLFAAQPKIFKEFKSSAGDMWGFHVKGKSAAGDIKDAMQDGVIGSGWRSSELPDIARSDYFNWLTGEKPKLVDRYWNWIGKRNDAREDTGRLASYRYAKKEWEAGRPFYGASVPADVNALATPRLKAAKVAREILIDYGRGTEFSNFTRQKLVPFFKWMEGNFVRYQQLIKNLPTQEGGEARLAGATAKKTATLGLRLGAAYGIVNLWNHMFFPQEEEELGEGRNQLHLILGRDDQGNVQTIRFQGALSDLLGWVGMENLPQDVEDLATGKADVGDKMQDAYEAGLGRAVNASLPFAKTAAEIGLERSFYPNALQPRPVRDKAEHAAGLFSLKPVYQWLAGKPHKPLRQEIANLITYTTDPGEAAYNTTRHMAGEWLEEHGEERANVIPGKKSNALYYYKQALRYKDQATAQKFLDEYNRLGGSREGLTQSIKASAPLSMLGKQRGAFLDSLSPQEQEAVKRAEEWYRKVYER